MWNGVTLLYSRDWHNIVQQLYFNLKKWNFAISVYRHTNITCYYFWKIKHHWKQTDTASYNAMSRAKHHFRGIHENTLGKPKLRDILQNNWSVLAKVSRLQKVKKAWGTIPEWSRLDRTTESNVGSWIRSWTRERILVEKLAKFEWDL